MLKAPATELKLSAKTACRIEILLLNPVTATYNPKHSKKLIENEFFSQLSALIFAFTPSIVMLSVAGFSDYHILVIFLVLLAIYFINLTSPYELLASIPLTLLAFSWMGAPIYASLIALSSLIKFDDRKIKFSALSFLLPVISYVCQPFIALSFIVISLFLFAGLVIKKWRGERGVVAYTIASAIAVLALYFIPVKELQVVKSGISYLFGLSIYLPTIAEAKQFDVYGIMYISGVFTFIMAVPGLLLLKDRFIQTLFATSFTLALLQLRFTDVLAISVALLSAYTICMVLERQEFPVFGEMGEREIDRKKVKGRKKKDKSKADNRRRGDWATAILFILFLLLPSIIVSIKPLDISEDWENALLWMKNNTEPTSHYLHPENKPEYAVMSWWDYGNWILYLAKRAVVCNNFQAGAIDAAKFFTAQSEEEALKIVKRRGVRYVITDDEMGINNESGKFRAIMQIAGFKTFNKTEVRAIYNNSMYYKLHVENAESLKKFRLIKEFGEVKIFKVLWD